MSLPGATFSTASRVVPERDGRRRSRGGAGGVLALQSGRPAILNAMDEPTYLDLAEAWAVEHRTVLREAVGHWLEHGQWPTVTQLGMSALRRDDSDIFETLRALPPPLGRVERPDERVELRLRALAMVPATEPLLSTFMRVLYLVSQRLMADDEENMVVRDTDLTETLSIPADASIPVSRLVFAEDWMLGGGSGNADGHWERIINERSLPIRGVKSIDDYLQVEGQRFWNRPANRSSTPAVMPIEEATFIELTEPALLASQLHPALSARAATLLAAGHYDEAVRAASLALRDLLRQTSGRHDLDGTDLVGAVLGGTSPSVRLADISTPHGKREQDGWRMLAEGCVAVLRNPVAHRDVYTDSISTFEALVTMSLVARQIDGSRKEAPQSDQAPRGEAR